MTECNHAIGQAHHIEDDDLIRMKRDPEDEWLLTPVFMKSVTQFWYCPFCGTKITPDMTNGLFDKYNCGGG